MSIATVSIIPFIFVCIIGIIALYAIYKISYSPPPKKERIIQKFQKKDFIIYNYLPKHSIKIDVFNKINNVTSVLCPEVKPLSQSGISKSKADKYFTSDHILKIYILSNKNVAIPYADYIIDTPEKTRIKCLRVGMITTRFIGSTDSFRAVATAANATGGQPWINVYNFTKIPLNINSLIIPPNGILRHSGYLHRGIPLGTLFTDNTEIETPLNPKNIGLFPEYEYTRPYNSLFYGVTSDLEQPLNGDFQLEFSDKVDYAQTLWPLVDGQY